MDDGDKGISLGKKNSGKSSAGPSEVDYRTKAGTAWSHNFLNQKPWHPLSYPNQRRKWIAEQTHANRERRTEEVAREFAQEQEFFRQSALFSKKEKEKVEMMKAVSFMYVRPPGYNPESAKAAEVADERNKLEENIAGQEPTSTAPVTDTKPDKKARPKDVFGRSLPTEEEFEVLKNAPRLETGMPARVKPFGIEIRNVRCVRCGTFGHQSGDRECPLKDAIMPNEESRLKRDDPLTAILAQTDSSEPLKWELKQKPGMSPPRGGFQPDDPNQQIVAEEIFDEYGGFLSGGHIPALILDFSTKKSQEHSKGKSRHKQPSVLPKRRYRDRSTSVSDTEDDRGRKREKKKHKKKRRYRSESSISGSSDLERRRSRSSSYSEDYRERKNKHRKNKRGHFESSRYHSSDSEHRGVRSFGSEDDRERKKAGREVRKTKRYPESSRQRDRFSSASEVDRERNRGAKGKHKEEEDSNSYGSNRRKRC